MEIDGKEKVPPFVWDLKRKKQKTNLLSTVW